MNILEWLGVAGARVKCSAPRQKCEPCTLHEYPPGDYWVTNHTGGVSLAKLRYLPGDPEPELFVVGWWGEHNRDPKRLKDFARVKQVEPFRGVRSPA